MEPSPDLAHLRVVLGSRRHVALTASEGSRAAVAAILRPGGSGPEVLLIRRADNPDDPWSGHMAFPGGRVDPDDPDLLGTARREAREELGLDLGRAAVLLGRLDDVPAVARGRHTGLVISVFVFELGGDPRLQPNAEVAEALWAPLGPMARGEVDAVRPYRFEGRTLKLPAYRVEGRIVWGLTYQMLRALLQL